MTCPVSYFELPVSCPSCGGDVLMVNTGTSGSLAVAVVECPPCRKEWEVTVRIAYHGLSQAAVAAAAAAKQEAKCRARVSV